VGARDASVVGDGSVEGRVLVEVNLASTINTLVRVGLLSDDTTPGEDVLHSVPLEATIATLVADGLATNEGASVRAINEELLRVLAESTGLDSVDGLDVGDGGEGPARTALALVLDGVNVVTLLSPVEGSGGGLGGERGTLNTVGEARTSHNLSLLLFWGERIVTLVIILQKARLCLCYY
jgi:hypothetical protein